MQVEQVKLIEEAVRMILTAIGENPDREGLIETPRRVAKLYSEIYAGVPKTNEEIGKELLKVFSDDGLEGADTFGDIVIVKDIPFYSTCEHHLVTIIGKAHVGYIPGKQVIGISKIARLVDMVAKRPQLQERISRDVLNILVDMLSPTGVMVVIEGRHMCMEARGVKKPGAVTVTSATYGAFKEDPKTRNEFLNLIQLGRQI